MSIGIKGKFIVGFDGEEHRLLTDGVVIFYNNRIKYVGKSYNDKVDQWIDASRSLVSPGLINTHVHASTTPKDKSFLEDVGARHFYMSSLGENLTALGLSMRRDDYEIFAKYSIAECLRSGASTIVEIGMINSLGIKRTVEIKFKWDEPKITNGPLTSLHFYPSTILIFARVRLVKRWFVCPLE